MATRIQVRRGTNTQWNTTDPILNEGEFGYSTTDSQFKIGDGTTIWSLLDYVPSATSLGSSLGDYIELAEKGAVDGVAELDGSKNILAPAGIIFEGTANDHETTLSVTDPTADRTITFPDATGTVITTGNLSDITNIGVFTSTIVMEGSSADDFELTLSAGNPTEDRTITFPDATGTVALTSDIAELSQDAIDTALTAGTGITKTYNDGANTLTLAVDTTTIQARVTDVSDTEIGYLNGVTSGIQTQLDGKSGTGHTHTAANVTDFTEAAQDAVATAIAAGTHTNITITYDDENNKFNFVGANTYSDENAQDAVGNALGTGLSYNDSSGAISVDTTIIQARVADVSDTEIGYLNGVTSGIQSQIDAKAPLASPTFTGTLNAADLTLSGNLTVNGTTTTINSTTLTVDDKNIVLADGNTSDASADGGGITLSGATSKTFNWVDATDAWTSSEHMNLLTGKSYKINNTAISAALPALTWGEVKNGKSGLAIS